MTSYIKTSKAAENEKVFKDRIKELEDKLNYIIREWVNPEDREDAVKAMNNEDDS